MEDLKKIISKTLKNHFNIKIAAVDQLFLGADQFAFVYKIKDTTGKLFFLKVKTKDFNDFGLKLMNLFMTSGINDVVTPIQTTSGNLFYCEKNLTFILYPFIGGSNGFTFPLNQHHFFQLGQIVFKIHNLNIPSEMKNLIPKEDFSPQNRIEISSLLQKISNVQTKDDISEKLIQSLVTNRNLINQIIKSAEDITKLISAKSHDFVLCHSDLHAGNILFDENDHFYIIDWDNVVFAPKERDLMFIGGGVGNVWNQENEEDSFYKGYGSISINQDLITYYRLERIIVDIIEYIKMLIFDTSENKSRVQMYKEFQDMFEKRGVIDIALS